MRILDLCAGAGGETLLLAAAVQGEGRVDAYDIDREALERLRHRAERARSGATVRVLQAIPEEPSTRCSSTRRLLRCGRSRAPTSAGGRTSGPSPWPRLRALLETPGRVRPGGRDRPRRVHRPARGERGRGRWIPAPGARAGRGVRPAQVRRARALFASPAPARNGTFPDGACGRAVRDRGGLRSGGIGRRKPLLITRARGLGRSPSTVPDDAGGAPCGSSRSSTAAARGPRRGGSCGPAYLEGPRASRSPTGRSAQLGGRVGRGGRGSGEEPCEPVPDTVSRHRTLLRRLDQSPTRVIPRRRERRLSACGHQGRTPLTRSRGECFPSRHRPEGIVRAVSSRRPVHAAARLCVRVRGAGRGMPGWFGLRPPRRAPPPWASGPALTICGPAGTRTSRPSTPPGQQPRPSSSSSMSRSTVRIYAQPCSSPVGS